MGSAVTPGSGERDPTAAAETFGLLSDETRVRILVVLAEAPAEGVRFSELRSRVGVSDSGQFNYHLDRLRDRLVTRTGEGYALTETGAAVASLL
ncbi:MAG: hypothetical protein ABEJ26_03425 [Halosimplex sp.]